MPSGVGSVPPDDVIGEDRLPIREAAAAGCVRARRRVIVRAVGGEALPAPAMFPYSVSR